MLARLHASQASSASCSGGRTACRRSAGRVAGGGVLAVRPAPVQCLAAERDSNQGTDAAQARTAVAPGPPQPTTGPSRPASAPALQHSTAQEPNTTTTSQQQQQQQQQQPLNGSSSNNDSSSSSTTTTSNQQQQSASQQQQQPPPPPRPGSLASLLQAMPALCRKALGVTQAAEAAELLLSERPELILEQEDCELLIQAALDRGNIKLALSVHDAMQQARRGSAGGRPAGGAQPAATASVDGAFAWPPAALRTTSALVLGLCRQLAIEQALGTVADIRAQGLPRNDAVGFGKVITSPLAPGRTLTVVQPQEGLKVVADAFSRYEYELFSGKVLTVKSEALQPSAGLLQAALRALGVLRRPPAAAIHEFTVQAPDGTSRTFRVATPTANVPAQVGERVTFVCSPSPASARLPQRKRRSGGINSLLFAPSPPDTRPGEALTATNHQTGAVSQLLPPPASSAQAGSIPSWVLPVAVVLAGGDAASSLIDPALPALIAAAAVSVGGSVVAGDRLLIPKLKQLPEKSLGVEYVRQQLLGQYAQLSDKADAVLAEAAEDVRVLARLWQLQNKMQSVAAVGAGAGVPVGVGGGDSGGGAAGATALAPASSYVARMERVAAARAGVEARLAGKLELLDGYTRVMNVIEIEVEMDIEVPAAELAGIEQQMVRLQELEGLQDEWRVQAEARDEVERLLRTP